MPVKNRAHAKSYTLRGEGLARLYKLLGCKLPGNVLCFFSVPWLAVHVERHLTFASKERAIMLKLAFFQVCTTRSSCRSPGSL